MQTNLMCKPIIMFAGKGGVGKTTCSAATALQLSSCGRHTLLITSDATPSLSDIFEEEIGGDIRPLDNRLDAVEISGEAILNKWKNKFGPDFYEILSRLIDVEELDNESRHQLLDYIGSAPSLREETLLDLVVDLAETSKYDRIVWDTAPAGETLNLLNMPASIRKHLTAGSKVFEGLDKIGRKVIGKRSIAEIMDSWITASERISRSIHARSTFVLVANPEALVVKQAQRVVEVLSGYRITFHGMVINKVIRTPDSQLLKTLQELQAPYLTDLIELASGLPVAMLPFALKEIKGRRALKEVGEGLIRELMLQG
jgi:arsenite-transporting ATPase